MLSPPNTTPSFRRNAEAFFIDSDWGLATFWIGNAILSIVVKSNATAATLHALLITLTALYLTFAGRRSEYVAYICAFIVGSEVLWRMSHASVFYEISKYSVALCGLVTVARMKRKSIPLPALTYLLLLVPSALVPIISIAFSSHLHKQLSFNLSGPIALAAAMCLFVNLKLTRPQLWRIVVFLVTPIIGVAAVTLFATHTASEEQLVFSTESNKVTSGGFGPNQVSSTLGLGAALLLLYLAQEDMSARRKMMVSAGLLLCIVQSAMTFSRSGLYAAFGAFAAALIFLVQDRRILSRLTYVIGLGTAVIVFIVIPYVVAFTDGRISQRFSSTKLTGREEIMATDLAIWKNNPIYGVGVGFSSYYHPRNLSSHNELSRLIAEHGVFGLGAILTLLLFGLHRLTLARSAIERAFIAVMFTWPLLFMMVNGFRVAAPAFIIGLGCVNFSQDLAEPLRRSVRRLAHAPVEEPQRI